MLITVKNPDYYRNEYFSKRGWKGRNAVAEVLLAFLNGCDWSAGILPATPRLPAASTD
jgi:hypothetical protein